MKILVAEDDENSRKLLETVLANHGYHVCSAQNGLEALQYLQDEQFDLIVSDILMPEMDGFGLCKAVKQHHALQKIPFIFYTATYTSDKDEQFAKSLGATKFLVKPMIMSDFLGEVADALRPGQVVRSIKRSGLNRTSHNKVDKQYAERVRSKLDKKVVELEEQGKRLAESETRFRDFAEASADWFWESDAQLKISAVFNAPRDIHFSHLADMAAACHSHTSNEMLKTLEEHHQFADFIIHTTNQHGRLQYLRVSGKPILEQGVFKGYRGVARDVTEMISLNRRVEFLATHDELTGLPNRSQFRQRLEHALVKAERSGQQVLLLFFDLDRFKMVNDTLGHDAGDQLLIQAAKRITERVRATDILCRLGGDEFVMIMEGASPQDGHRCVREIIRAFAKPFEIEKQRIYCTVSIGVSVYPDDAQDPESLVVYADLAMYRAKQNGRNDFQFYTSNLNFIAHQWLEMEHGIRQALTDDQFFLVYQPQYENLTGRIVGMEALLRWRHPERGMIPPLEFIKIAEQSSLINDVGEFVVEASCRQIRDWLDQGLHVPRVSINISARHLRSDKLGGFLSDTMKNYAITADMLCLEITENALLEEVEIVKKNMRLIKDIGLAISLDDFGMGHSSLLYLKRWAVDEVKIDRSFVDGLVNNEDDRAIVRAIVALAQALDLNLVGEGVENQEQVDVLATCGCTVLQGYYFAHPMPAQEMGQQLNV